MRQLTFVGPRRLEWWEVPEPRLEAPSDALVRPIVAARCDGDPAFTRHDACGMLCAGLALGLVDPAVRDLFGARPFAPPFAIGHECVAEVVACGDAVRGFERGDVVVVPWAVSCGACSSCQLGLTSKCTGAGRTPGSAYGLGAATGSFGGVVSDLVRVPHAEHMLVRVPAGITPRSIASAGDNIPDGWRAVAPGLKHRPGAPVLVVGGAAASIGLYAAAIAVALGSEQVDYLDHDAERLAIAEAVGARPLERPRAGRARWYRKHAPVRGTYPISVDATSQALGLTHALRSLAPGGTCTSVGYLFRRTTGLPLMQMYANDSTLRRGVSHARAALPDVLALVASSTFRPERVTTTLAPWQDADRAYLERGTKLVLERPPLFARDVPASA